MSNLMGMLLQNRLEADKQSSGSRSAASLPNVRPGGPAGRRSIPRALSITELHSQFRNSRREPAWKRVKRGEDRLDGRFDLLLFQLYRSLPHVPVGMNNFEVFEQSFFRQNGRLDGQRQTSNKGDETIREMRKTAKTHKKSKGSMRKTKTGIGAGVSEEHGFKLFMQEEEKRQEEARLIARNSASDGGSGEASQELREQRALRLLKDRAKNSVIMEDILVDAVLDFESMGLTAAAVPLICKFVERNFQWEGKTYTGLNLAANLLGDKGVGELLPCLRPTYHVETLDLRSANLNPSCFVALAAALPLSCVKKLRLGVIKGRTKNQMGSQGGEAMASALGNPDLLLEELGLRGLGTPGMSLLFQGFKHEGCCPKLRRLDLQHNWLSENTLVTLFTHVANTNITHLLLGSNELTLRAADALVKLCRRMRTLQSLRLNSCQIAPSLKSTSSSFYSLLGSGLASTPSSKFPPALTTLVLDDNQVGLPDGTVTYPLTDVERFRSIQTLSLVSCGITQLKVLGQKLRYNHVLRRLTLRNNFLGDQGAIDLAHALLPPDPSYFKNRERQPPPPKKPGKGSRKAKAARAADGGKAKNEQKEIETKPERDGKEKKADKETTQEAESTGAAGAGLVGEMGESRRVLSYSLCALEYLDLSRTGVEDEGAQALATVLPYSRHLLSLDLSDNNITAKGGSKFVNCFKDVLISSQAAGLPLNDFCNAVDVKLHSNRVPAAVLKSLHKVLMHCRAFRSKLRTKISKMELKEWKDNHSTAISDTVALIAQATQHNHELQAALDSTVQGVHDFKKEVLSSVAEEEDPMVEMLLNKEARKRKEELDYKQLENQIKMALRNFNKRDAEVADKMANANEDLLRAMKEEETLKLELKHAQKIEAPEPKALREELAKEQLLLAEVRTEFEDEKIRLLDFIHELNETQRHLDKHLSSKQEKPEPQEKQDEEEETEESEKAPVEDVAKTGPEQQSEPPKSAVKRNIKLGEDVEFIIDVVTSRNQLHKATKMHKSHTVFTLSQQHGLEPSAKLLLSLNDSTASGLFKEKWKKFKLDVKLKKENMEAEKKKQGASGDAGADQDGEEVEVLVDLVVVVEASCTVPKLVQACAEEVGIPIESISDIYYHPLKAVISDVDAGGVNPPLASGSSSEQSTARS